MIQRTFLDQGILEAVGLICGMPAKARAMATDQKTQMPLIPIGVANGAQCFTARMAGLSTAR